MKTLAYQLAIRLLTVLVLTATVLFIVVTTTTDFDASTANLVHPDWMPRDVGSWLGARRAALPWICSVMLVTLWVLFGCAVVRVRREFPWRRPV